MVINALRDIGGFIDKAIYWFVELLLQLILDLADTQIFSQSVITEFANRIYIILGLVMLFKIIISFIQILINPDKMDDKEQGVGNILMRVVISLLLIVLVPSIFSLARQLQSYIIPIIPKVVLGTAAGSTDGDMMNTSGRAMAFYSYTAFFTYNNPECNDGSIYGTGNDPTKVTVYDVPSAVKNINEKCPDSSDENGYRYKYDWPMSMIVGIYLVFMLVQIAVAVAIRAIKLGICEFIAPIPIASYIDPKTSKQAFDNWVSTSIKTYLDLFTRLIVVYFVVFVFMIIVADETFDTILASVGGDTTRQALVVIAIIIGLLQFAKQAPKFISDMLGVKEGMGDIGGMFRGQGWKDMVSSVGGLAGMVTTPLSAALSARNYSKLKGEGGWRQAGRFLRGFTSGAIGATSSAFSGKGWKGAKDVENSTLEGIRKNINNSYIKRKARDRYKGLTQNYSDAQNKISTLSENLKSETELLENAKERSSSSWYEYLDAKKRGDTKMANVHLMNYQNAKAAASRYENSVQQMTQEIKDLEKIRKPVRPSSYGLGKLQSAYNNFTGTPVPTSKSYNDAANVMYSGKKIFNDAKTKVEEDPTLIKDTISFSTKDGTSYGSGTFADIYSAYRTARSTGSAKLNGKAYNVATIEGIYGEALKTTATTYVDRVKEGTISNGTMKYDLDMFDDKINNDIIVDSADRADISANYNVAKPGKYLKGADEIGKSYEERARDLQSYESSSN